MYLLMLVCFPCDLSFYRHRICRCDIRLASRSWHIKTLFSSLVSEGTEKRHNLVASYQQSCMPFTCLFRLKCRMFDGPTPFRHNRDVLQDQLHRHDAGVLPRMRLRRAAW